MPAPEGRRRARRLLPLAIRALALLPAWSHAPLAQGLAVGADFLGLRHARTTDTSLALAAPGVPARTRRALARRCLVEDARLALALPAVWHRDPAHLLAAVDGDEAERRLRAAQGAGRGVLLLVPHLGNWELLCLWLQARSTVDAPFTALYEPLRDPSLDRWLQARRQRTGARLLPTDAAGLRAFLRTLRRGGTVALLPDQVPPRHAGVLAPFHGRPAWTMTLVRGLARRAAPQLLALACLRTEGGHRIHAVDVDPAVDHADPQRAATALNATVETCIALAPEQYQWGYKRYRHAAPNEADYYDRRGRARK